MKFYARATISKFSRKFRFHVNQKLGYIPNIMSKILNLLKQIWQRLMWIFSLDFGSIVECVNIDFKVNEGVLSKSNMKLKNGNKPRKIFTS